MTYLLKNKDRIAVEFEVENIQESFGFGEYLSESITNATPQDSPLPFGIDKNNLKSSLAIWIRHRKIPQNRAFVQEIINSYRNEHDNLMDYVNVSFALSLNDSFWITPANKEYKWSDYNLYENEFSEILQRVAFGLEIGRISGLTSSPEFTTNGMLKKCWHRENGEIYLYKGNSEMPNFKEVYSEYYAAQAAKALGFEAISYDIKEFHNQLVSSCPIFTNQNEGYVPIYYFLDEAARYCKGFALLKALEQIYGKHQNLLNDLLFFDAMVGNKDRHLGNFGMIVDNDTLEILRPAPIFDNGLSMFRLLPHTGNAHTDNTHASSTHANNESFDTQTLQKSSWFEFSFEEQLSLCANERYREKMQNLQYFTFTRHPRFNLDEDCLSMAENNIRLKAKMALQFIDKNISKRKRKP